MTPMHKQLTAAGLDCFPCWVRYNHSKQRYDKGPSVPRGVSWKDISALDGSLDWSSGVVGVPIPPDVLVVDADLYKNANGLADFEAWLGTPLDWDVALIQDTVGGGRHYAFRCPWPARQLGDDEVPGMDTRAAGRGFICSGAGYVPVGMGVFRLAAPDSLPLMPDAARERLEVRTPEPPSGDCLQLPDTPDVERAVSAMHYLDPGCSRAKWFRILCALRAMFRDDELTGRDLAERWSAGEFWSGDAPHNYVADGPGSIDDQWPTIKPDGDIQPATLYYEALDAGWHPPASFNTAAAFGAAEPVYDALVERVQESGGDVKQTAVIVEEIRAAGCSALQVALLAAELKAALRDAGIKDKAVSGHIDSLLRTVPRDEATPAGLYGKNDADNAALFLSKYFPDGTLARCDGEFYRYTGKAWERITADSLRGLLYRDMAQQRMQDSRMGACFRTVSNLIPTRDGQLNRTPDTLVLFDNGVLDLTDGTLAPHDRGLFTTNIMPYSWDPIAQCPQWLAFLNDAFDGDQERIDLLQEWFGYLMTRRYDHQKIMFLLGGPRCGKGTIGRVLKALVGPQNFSGGSLSSLAADSYIDGIRTKPVVFIGDAQKKISPSKINEVIERLKSISGNDEVTWHRMYYGALSETLPTRFTFAANNVPGLFDDSGALASRMLLLTFEKSYLGREDLTLGDRLEAEVAGVAAWALYGLRRLSQRGRFTEPAASACELDDLRSQYSPLSQFIAERCTVGPDARCDSTELYECYRAWVLEEGADLLPRRVFTSAIKDATRGRGVRYGAHRIDGGVSRGFRGIEPAPAPPTGYGRAFTPRIV